ncbi:hypothetical protein [Tissierella sp. Yu-01]|uniref:hypothetical protein n=1 Tax=Tissierella sp. Yu-01 TaxID=3035694 RepID=UPI00240E3255|nr:hypothetical protein [Tissierella sp. Yu-01]WFA09041.1 hypothetical protein P3962_00295 [Tissierella sp. Yu-01]
MESRRKRFRFRYVFLSVMITGIIIFTIKYKYEHTFSTNRWIEFPRERVKMVDSLLEKHVLVGKSKEEIIGLLGNETENAYFKEVNNFVYYMGDERGLISIDSEWLVIEFRNNVVIDAKIMRD